jgi:DNA polymerase
MEPYGNNKLGIMNIGEAPGGEEDAQGKPWQGKVGKRLQREYHRLGIDLFDDCINLNAVHCRPTDKHGNNRAPTEIEIGCCRRRVLRAIREYKPKVIVLLGNSPISSVIGHVMPGKLGGVSKWRGWNIPDQQYRAWVCPVFHPSYVERLEAREADTVWRQDLANALAMVDKPFPDYRDDNEHVHLLNPAVDVHDIQALLHRITEHKLEIAIDYETTGLKPHRAGHKILCLGIAISDTEAYAFETPQDDETFEMLLRVLQDPQVSLMAHNMKYEIAWTKAIWDIEAQGWSWDSMLGAHMIDNRSGICSLKHQTYLNFGIPDYSTDISPHLQGKDSNGFNNLSQYMSTVSGRQKTLHYCGLDALYNYRLAHVQRRVLNERASTA